MYPYSINQYADGVSTMQTRFAVMADPARWDIADIEEVL
jgi:hypothetical protein